MASGASSKNSSKVAYTLQESPDFWWWKAGGTGGGWSWPWDQRVSAFATWGKRESSRRSGRIWQTRVEEAGLEDKRVEVQSWAALLTRRPPKPKGRVAWEQVGLSASR